MIMLPHYLEKVKCSNLMHFCIINCFNTIKAATQTHGGNIRTTQLIIKFSRTVL